MFIITKTHFEYNDNNYDEAGSTPFASYEDRAAAEDEANRLNFFEAISSSPMLYIQYYDIELSDEESQRLFNCDAETARTGEPMFREDITPEEVFKFMRKNRLKFYDIVSIPHYTKKCCGGKKCKSL